MVLDCFDKEVAPTLSHAFLQISFGISRAAGPLMLNGLCSAGLYSSDFGKECEKIW